MSDRKVNDMVIRFANVNGTGSASANDIFAKSIFRMGIPITPKNIFPSNIQGLPTWYEIRVSDKGYLGRREAIDLLIGVNPQSMAADVASIREGGFFVYDSTRRLHSELIRPDIHYLGVPMMELSMAHWENPRQQQLFKNIIYAGAVAWLIGIETEVIETVIAEQFARKPKLVEANHKALSLGRDYAKEHFDGKLDICLERRNANGDKIMVDGNTAIALGAIYGGATVAAWYPITPSTSVVSSFEKYAKKLRVDPDTGKNKFAIIQAEDELAAIGMAIGANWNGARSFTATSGAGVSLMNEFIGLAYYAEVPCVLVNVQRGGPSTGMPTRTQQADLITCAYASHGDTKHVMLFPSTPAECFDMTATAFDLADRLQTLIFVMSDLDLAMNDHISEPLNWDETRQYDLGKVLNAEELEAMTEPFARYRDVDGDGIPYRTIPGVHPTLGSYFTRGSSHDENAKYTESEKAYVRVVDRIRKKWEVAKQILPRPEAYKADGGANGMIFFGTSTYAALEVMDLLLEHGIDMDAMRVLGFPFHQDVADFVAAHETVFVIEQNKDAQFRTLLINELETNPKKLIRVLNYDGFPITADTIFKQIAAHLPQSIELEVPA